MRLAAQCKLGFYPAAPQVIDALVKHLRVRPPDPEKPLESPHVIDPCCGEGSALAQIVETLGIGPQNAYAVELDAWRAERAKLTLTGGHVLGPASFPGVQITGQSFGLAYVNPPFDDELGGGKREEQAFAERAARLLVPKGILVLVCPLSALSGNRELCGFFDAHFDEVCVYKFPDGHRPYNEVVVIGRKRRETIPLDALYKHGCLHRMGLTRGGFVAHGGMDRLPALGACRPVSWREGEPSPELEPVVRTWEVPRSGKPNTFKKTAFTEDELVAAVASSPLNRLLREVAVPPLQGPAAAARQGTSGTHPRVRNARRHRCRAARRPCGQGLLAQGRVPQQGAVHITKLDRAFRRLADCVVTLEKFEAMGVKLHVVNMLGGAIDLSSPMGRFLTHILAAFAELERAFISERTRDGLAKRKHDRVAHTRFPGYGKRWEKRWVDGKPAKVAVPDDDERSVMKSILQWRTQKAPLSWKEIADHFTYTLKLKTRDGFLWDANRVRRACDAELNLQLLEQRGDDERAG